MTLLFLLEYKFVLTFLTSSDQHKNKAPSFSLNIHFVKKTVNVDIKKICFIFQTVNRKPLKSVNFPIDFT